MPWDCFACLKPESTDVKQLNYEHCTLNDVPAEVFVFERTLEELQLDSNRIRDLPRPLFHCHGLKVLSLSDNEVHSLPPAIASLINLQHLDVSRNALNSIPDNLKGCKHLTYVDVSVNPLEKLPEGFTQLISLEELYLNDTYLDFLPANFGRLMRLKILELRENNLNTLPKSIARLAHLQRLDIGQNDFSDMPEVIGNLPNLTELWVDSNHLRSIPHLIGNLKKLVHLEASNNNIRAVAPEIEHCIKLVDLSLTCNELTCLPSSIGNLKELVTLKVDDNQLSVLPNTIGKLSNLEELILSQNYLESLPACIGLLRKLHILNIDDNMLEELPPEIGSCTSLTILSAHSNKLLHVPAELGHLSNLRVVNLSENHLQNLPVSILNLVNLTALWLSNNQSTPLTTLQQEIDKHTGQMVCINFMLPQSIQETNPLESHWLRQEVCRPANQPGKVKPHISFATDTDAEVPSRLLRAPTPYPKELRAMAKHARAIHHLKRSSKENEEDLPIIEEMVSQEPMDVLIKEAKVKKPSIDPVGEQLIAQHFIGKNKEIHEKVLDAKGFRESDAILEEYDDVIYGSSFAEMPSAIALDTAPIVREAICVRKMNSSLHSLSLSSESRQRGSVVSNSEQNFQHPPPYHIAAVYSKQAMFFMQKDAKFVPKMHNNSPEASNCSSGKVKDEQIHQEKSDTISNIEPRKEDKNFITLSSEVSTKIDKCDFISCERNQKDSAVNNVPCERNSLSVDSSKEENVSDEVMFLSMPSPKLDITTAFDNHAEINENSSIRGIREGSSIDDLIECEVIDPSKSDSLIREEQNDLRTDNQNILLSNFNQGSEEDGADVQFLQKPQTFTQDKPIICEGVIAPTPQRPRSSSFGTSETQPPEIKVLSSPSLRKEFNNVSQHISFLKAGTEKYQINDNALSPSNRTTQNFEPDITKETFVASNNSKISSFHFPENINVCAADTRELSRFAPQETYFISPSDIAKTEQNHSIFQRSSLTNRNLNPQCKPLNEYNVNSHNNKNNMYKEGKFIRMLREELPTSHTVRQAMDTSCKAVEMPANQQLHVASQVKVSNASNLNLNSCGDVHNKHPTKWMFGPHKNATVFPVTIQKNPGLGFSISGGLKNSSCNDRCENEIFVTKVHPSGPASSILMPGDKILEVDGIDFTKLEHDEAVTVLKQTGNLVNMMISRQQ